ncbi:UgpB ABC-type sugar transport system, periplasmic component [Candidatus Nanopelagicaceae bacterium]|jgi:raffinose/stachyose/melibiose transport system substrate-binding protein
MFKGKKLVAVIASSLLGLAVVTGCSSSDSADKILRIATPSLGEKELPVWETAKAAYEAAHEGWTVEFIQQDDDLYSTVGLPTLLNGKNSPDAYFEWSGARLDQRVAEGYAADISGDIESSGLKDLFAEGAFAGYDSNGALSMIPRARDVTNVLWYNVDMFEKNGVTPPTTWDELNAACAKFVAAKVNCFVQGNKDLWTVGNWGGHIISRVTGEALYAETLQKKKPMNSPEFVKGLTVLADLAKAGYVNESVNSIADNEAASQFFQGKAAFHPIGSWLIGTQQGEAPDFKMDFINLPAIADGAGDQNSIMAVYTGYIVNAKSTKKTEVMDFFKELYSADNAKAIADAGTLLLVKSLAGGALDPLTEKINTLLNGATVVVAPPDTGFELPVADALNAAQAEAIGGKSTPQAALDAAQEKVAALK